MDTATLPSCAPCPQRPGGAVWGTGCGVSAVLAAQLPAWVPTGVRTGKPGGHGDWASGGGPVCCLPASAPSHSSAQDRGPTHQGQRGGAASVEHDSGPSCHHGNSVA